MEMNENITLKLADDTIELEVLENQTYQYEIKKALSNINDEYDLMALTDKNLNHLACTYEVTKEDVIITYATIEKYSSFSKLKNKTTHDKLHVLKNIVKFIKTRDDGYTYILHPDNIVYDDNFMPLFIYVGLKDILEPLRQDDEELLHQSKCLIVSLFDKKYDFNALYSGGLDLVNKTKFFEKIINATSLDELKEVLEDSFTTETQSYENTNTIVSKNKYNIYKVLAITGVIVSLVLAALAGHAYLRTVPYANRMNEASHYFVAGNYGGVISTLRHENISNLPITQKYMLAHAYVIAEPMNERTRESVLSVLSTSSDELFLEFWIYIGQEDYERAIEIAQELSDLRLLYHAYFRAIEIIRDDREMSGAQKDELMSMYQNLLDEVEESLFGEE
jgi:type VII secretion protein EssB